MGGAAAAGGGAPLTHNHLHNNNTTTSDRVEKGAELRERPERERSERDRDRGDRDSRVAGERRWNEPTSGSAGYGQSRDDKDRQAGGGWKRSTEREYGRDRGDRGGERDRERDRERAGERTDRREFGGRGGDKERDRDRERAGGETEAAERFAAAFGRKGDGGTDKRQDRERSDGAGRGFDRSIRREEREYKDRDRDREREKEGDRDHKDRSADWGSRSHTDSSFRFPVRGDRRVLDDGERRGDAEREADEHREGLGFIRQPSSSSAPYQPVATADGTVQLDESEIVRLQAKYGPAASGPLAYSRDTILALFRPSAAPASLHTVSPELGLVSSVCIPPLALSDAATDTDVGPFWLSSKGGWHAKRQLSGTLGRRQYSGGPASHSQLYSTSGSDRSTPAWFDQPVASILDDEQTVLMTNERIERERADRRLERERSANTPSSAGRYAPERQRSENEMSGWTEAVEQSQSRRPTLPSTLGRSAATENDAASFESPPSAFPSLPVSPPSLPLSSISPAAVVAPVSQWYYKDPQDETQGPFSAAEMRDWYTKGYFDLKLRVMCTHTSDVQQQQQVDEAHFIPLGVWFIAGKKAFLDQVPTLTHEQPASTAPPAQQTAHVRAPQQQQHLQQHQAPPALRHTPQRPPYSLPLDVGDTDPRLLEGTLHGSGGGLYSTLQHDDEDDIARLADTSLRFVDDDIDRQPTLTQQSHMQPLYGRQQPYAAAVVDGSWSLPHVTPYPSVRIASPISASAAPGMGWPALNFSPHHSLATSSPRSSPLTAHLPPSSLHKSLVGGESGMLHEQLRQSAIQSGRPHSTAPQQQPSLQFAQPSPSHVAAPYPLHAQQQQQTAQQQRVAVSTNEQHNIAAQRQQQAVALARERLLQQQQQQQQQQQRTADSGSVWISSPQQLREREEMMRRQQQQQQLAEREEAERRRYEEQRALEGLHMERERDNEARAAQEEREKQQQRYQSLSAHSSPTVFRGASADSTATASSQSAHRWPTAALSSSASLAGRVLALSELQAMDTEEAAARDRDDARRQRDQDEEQRRAAAAALTSGSSVWKASGQRSASNRSLADIMAEEAQQSQTHSTQQRQHEEQHTGNGGDSVDSSACQQVMAARMKTAQHNAAAVWGVSQLPAHLTSVTHSSPAATAPAAPLARSQPSLAAFSSSSSSTTSVTREQRVAAERDNKGASEAERRHREESAQRTKVEEEGRRKAAAVERSKVQAAKVWGTQATTIDLRAIQQQEAEASRLAEERREQRLREQQLAAAQSTVLGSVWGGVNPLTQNVPPALAATATKSAVRAVSASGSNPGGIGGSAASPSPASSPPLLKDIQALEAQAAQGSTASPVRSAGAIVPPSSAGVWSSASTSNSHAVGKKSSSQQPAATIRLIDEPDDIWGYTASTAVSSGPQKPTRATSSGKAHQSPSAGNTQSTPPSSSPAAAFGVDVAMSADFSSWCRTQLNQITGSSDLTLAYYLLSLDSPQQVEETCITYLGAAEQVKRFAHHFIANAQFDRQGHTHRINSNNNQHDNSHSSSSRRDTEEAEKRKQRGKKRG